MKTDIFTRIVPPGIDLKKEKNFFVAGMVCAALYSLSFLISYVVAFGMLFEGEKIASFKSLLGNSLAGFVLLAMCMPGFIIYHYLYFRQGSKSIYLMKRLPHRTEIHKRALSLPVLAMLASLLAAFAIMMIYFAFYMLVTPNEYLPPNQWLELWRI